MCGGRWDGRWDGRDGADVTKAGWHLLTLQFTFQLDKSIYIIPRFSPFTRSAFTITITITFIFDRLKQALLRLLFALCRHACNLYQSSDASWTSSDMFDKRDVTSTRRFGVPALSLNPAVLMGPFAFFDSTCASIPTRHTGCGLRATSTMPKEEWNMTDKYYYYWRVMCRVLATTVS